MFRLIATIALSIWLCSLLPHTVSNAQQPSAKPVGPLSGYSLPQLQEKAIYAERVKGDTDEALNCYRQILEDHKRNRSVASAAREAIKRLQAKQNGGDASNQSDLDTAASGRRRQADAG